MHARRFIQISMALLAVALASISCGSGLSTQEKLNRIQFLTATRGKPDEALAFAKEAYQEEKTPEDRGKILMEGASIAFKLYNQTLKKSYIQEVLSLLNIVINEHLPQTPEAFFLVSQIYDKENRLDKALEYVEKAIRASTADKQKAATYHQELINLYMSRGDHESVVTECDRLIETYPDYQNLERIEALKEHSIAILKEQGNY